ncbi:MAG: antitoxin [Chthoniobacterales bacterium]
MIRTQIQLPDPLYSEIKRIAEEQDWSIAEVLRRGAEAILRVYPAHKKKKSTWSLPSPLKMKLLVEDPERIKDIIFEDSRPHYF